MNPVTAQVLTALGTALIGAIARIIEKRQLRKKGKLFDKDPNKLGD